MYFSTLLRGFMISCPQPVQRILKSAPIRSTSHVLLPQGCFFFMVTMSPTRISKVHPPFLPFFLMPSQYFRAVCSVRFSPYR